MSPSFDRPKSPIARLNLDEAGLEKSKQNALRDASFRAVQERAAPQKKASAKGRPQTLQEIMGAENTEPTKDVPLDSESFEKGEVIEGELIEDAPTFARTNQKLIQEKYDAATKKLETVLENAYEHIHAKGLDQLRAAGYKEAALEILNYVGLHGLPEGITREAFEFDKEKIARQMVDKKETRESLANIIIANRGKLPTAGDLKVIKEFIFRSLNQGK